MAGSASRGALNALWTRHPRQTVAVVLALAVCIGLLVTGLSLPLLHAQQMVFWKSSYSVWAGIIELWKQNELLLATLLFFFSIVFSFVKLTGLTYIWFAPLLDTDRARLLDWLGLLGKWSMLDVFIVAILIVLVKLGPMARVEPRAGVYVFAAAIAASMLTTMYVERVARSSPRPR